MFVCVCSFYSILKNNGLFTLDVLVQTYVFLWNGDVMVTLIATTPQTNGTVHVSEEDFALINLL